ncbi:hypothetical protein [Nocardioides sp. InS609-2]|uniref:hypothetical protein n=1 Tax=Nocardioides sp. InS609-2 TaxID=2760705 RepID=UPI0020BDA4EF|nr:hypothetical protein [Nocardioides sp. InS609-2]
MTGTDDFSPAERRGLRSAVLELKTRNPRGRFAIRVGAGMPGGPAHWFEIGVDDRLDHALRTEVAAALVHRVRPRAAAPWLWITRPGPLSVVDADLAWSSASRAALAEAGLSTRFVVVTRHGWREPTTGAGRAWDRLRPRS